MNDTLLVRGFEGFCNLLRNRQRLDESDGSLRDAIGQRRAFDQLQHPR